MRPVKPGFPIHLHKVGQQPASTSSPYGVSLLCCPGLSFLRTFFLFLSAKAASLQAERLSASKVGRGPAPDVSPSQFQRHRCCAQLPPAFISHATSHLEGSSMFRVAALAQGRNMTSRTPRKLCHLVAMVRPRQRLAGN